MERNNGIDTQREVSMKAQEKQAWTAPVLTKLQVEDAESGNNISENGATGS